MKIPTLTYWVLLAFEHHTHNPFWAQTSSYTETSYRKLQSEQYYRSQQLCHSYATLQQPLYMLISHLLFSENAFFFLLGQNFQLSIVTCCFSVLLQFIMYVCLRYCSLAFSLYLKKQKRVKVLGVSVFYQGMWNSAPAFRNDYITKNAFFSFLFSSFSLT